MKLAAIEYAGLSGISYECQEAVKRFIQYGDRIGFVQIVTHGRSHGLLLNVNEGDTVGIKTGFASGYQGEGPRTFSYVIQLLETHGAKIEEYEVAQEFLERLDDSALTARDISRLDSSRPIRPSRWRNYIDRDLDRRPASLWVQFPRVIPFALIDSRISDLVNPFWERAGDNLMVGYRRLEDTVRKRIHSQEHGAKLFSEAFVGPKSKLTWPELGQAEQSARGNLFVSIFIAYRNPRAHRERRENEDALLQELFLLNQLYVLERESVERVIKS